MFRITSTLNRNLYKRAITQPMLFTSPVENNNFTLKIAERSSSSNEKQDKERIKKLLRMRKPPPPSFNSSKVQNKFLEIEKFFRQWHEDNKNDDKGERYMFTLVIIKVPSNSTVYETKIVKMLQDITTELKFNYLKGATLFLIFCGAPHRYGLTRLESSGNNLKSFLTCF